INWNGNPLLTQFVTSSQLAATVPAANIAASGTASITVTSPGTSVASNSVFFPVTTPMGKAAQMTVVQYAGVGQYPSAIATADFNQDSNLDIAVANYTDSTISILSGDGTGHFSTSSTTAVDRYPVAVVSGDFNGDGKPDLAVGNIAYGSISILLGDGFSNF